MSKLNSNYELISNKASNPVTTTPYIKHGEKWLDEMLNESDGRIDSVESGVAANTEAISQNTTNISTNTTNISGLDTRVTALEQGGGGGGGGDNVGRIDRTEGATQHGEIFNMYTDNGDSKANRATGYMSHAEGVSTQASGACSHAEGSSTTASGSCSHAEGTSTTAFGSYSHAEGFNTQATASGSHAEGNGARAFKEAAHAEGVQTTADGLYAHAEGNSTTASAEAAHAEGKNSIASGLYSHAEGEYTYAEEWGAHSEGKNTTASGKYSHAENSYNEALGENSHAEGNYTISSGYRTHTEGFHTKASGDNAHAEGYYTKASSNNQHVSGTANIEDKANKYAVIVGNGLWEGNESNAYTLDWQGNAWYAGDVTGNKDGEEYKLSDMKDKYTLPEGGIPASDLAEGVLPTVTDEYNPEGTAAVSGKAVAAAISAIPTPMQFKGTLGTGGTKTSLPTAEASNEGHTYRVITAGTYASQAAKVGDVFVSNGSAWIHIPAGDDAANSIVMTNYTSDKSSAGTSAIANTDTVTKAIGKVDNRLGNAETEIGKKANKTSVSSSNETTSVINVTDAKAQMAMIASIKGKTRKMVQISGGFREWANTVGIGSLNSYNSYNSITWNGTNADSAFKIMVHKKLNVGDVVIARFTISAGSGTLSSYTTSGCAVDSNKTLFKTGVNTIRRTVTNAVTGGITDTGSFLGIDDAERTLVSMTISNAQIFNLTEMFGKGNEPTVEEFNSMFPTTYVPYTMGELWNTPVESVVSNTKNLWSAMSSWTEPSPKYTYNKVDFELPAGTYTFSMTASYSGDTKASNLILYDANSTALVNKTFNITTSSVTFTITTPVRYMSFYSQPGNYTNIQLEAGSSKTSYTPYNKTTVLVPSEARNCVGYGLGISDSLCNIADFENGVYTQMCAEVDLGTLTWNKDNANGVVWCGSTAIPVKFKAGNVDNVCSKYTTAATSTVEGTISVANNNISSSRAIQIKDANAMSASDIGKYLSGVKLVYELASTSTKPLTDFIRPLPVENGGTLTLVNEYNLDVNSVIKYKKEVS